MSHVPSRPLNDGRSIPAIGLGTYPLDDDEAAAAYGNEAGVGRAIASSRVPRAELQGGTDRGGGLVVIEGVGAQPDGGNRSAVVERPARNVTHQSYITCLEGFETTESRGSYVSCA